MTDQELERRLAKALDRTAPNDLEGVLSRCETRKGNVIQMTTKRKRPWTRALIAACLALALLGSGSVYQQAYAVASVVSLDVNPSIELTVSRNEKVLSCKGLNEEAKTVLADMNYGADLKGTKLNVAVNAIVGGLVQNGYLDSISSAILISVEDKDQTRAAKLQQELTATVDGVLQEQAVGAAVLSQTVKKDTALEQKARENNISTGKASLINRVVALNDALQFETLAELSVEELKDLIETGVPGMPIGRNEAVRLAKEYAGVKDSDLLGVEVDAELDDRTPHYDVELNAAGEFEYKVDAYSGKILQGQKNILSDTPVKPEQTIKPADPTPEKPAAKPEKAEKPSVSTGTGSSDIGSEQAKAAALAHAGVAESQTTRMDVERDQDDGRLEYEIDFKVGNMEYEYTIDAATGAVLEHEQDLDD